MEDRGPWEKGERLSAKEPPEWQARGKKPPKLPDTIWDDKRGEAHLPPESKNPRRLPDTAWDHDPTEPTLPPPRKPSPSYRPPPPTPRWGLRLIAIPVAAVVGGIVGQHIYDRGLTGAIKSASAFVVSSSELQGLAANAPAAVRVIDGDTIDYGGQRIRMVDYDAPEIGEPKCAYELELGKKATQRLREILNSGQIEIAPYGGRDVDKFGRKLRLVTVNNVSVGDYLVGEGLAVPWAGRRHHWCG